MKKIFQTKSLFLLVVLALFISLFSFKNISKKNFEIAKNIDIFSSVVKELDLFYVDTINPDKTVALGINSMLQSLDPYTQYFPEDEQSELEQMIKGSFSGIGSYITYNKDQDYCMISEPFKNTPAYKVGLKAGDIMLELDETSLKGLSVEQVSKKLRGQAGTKLTLKVKRPIGEDKFQSLEFDIVRESIQTPAIPYADVLSKDSIGYIKLTTFSGTPSKDLKKSFLDLKAKGAKSLIIDLRNNGGGLLDEAVKIANYFLPSGEVIVSTKGKIKQADNVYKTLREPLDLTIPIVVLVNGSTASAAEILSGALQDLDRAVIVGTRTFGKGLVQVPRQLPYGGMMKVTTSKYYIPSGRCVQAIDYSHRKNDGTWETIPDSLTHVFYTKKGREVRDGGGILPDSVVKPQRLPNILFYLIAEQYIFNYATDFCLTHDTISSPRHFSLTDTEYNDFKAMLLKSDFKYDQQSLKIMKALKKAAEFEGYWDSSKAEFEALKEKLSHNLDKDLDYFKKDILSVLNEEIVKRYYYQRGAIVLQLKEDKDLNAALHFLKNPEVYNEVLSLKDSTSVNP